MRKTKKRRSSKLTLSKESLIHLSPTRLSQLAAASDGEDDATTVTSIDTVMSYCKGVTCP